VHVLGQWSPELSHVCLFLFGEPSDSQQQQQQQQQPLVTAFPCRPPGRSLRGGLPSLHWHRLSGPTFRPLLQSLDQHFGSGGVSHAPMAEPLAPSKSAPQEEDTKEEKSRESPGDDDDEA